MAITPQTIPFTASRVLTTTPWVSAQRTLPAGVSDIEMQLTAATPWDGATGTLSWELQFLDGSGAWQFLVGQSDTNGNPLAFGSRSRSGSLPLISITNAGLGGLTVRLRAWSSQPITVTLDGTIS